MYCEKDKGRLLMMYVLILGGTLKFFIYIIFLYWYAYILYIPIYIYIITQVYIILSLAHSRFGSLLFHLHPPKVYTTHGPTNVVMHPTNRETM